MGIFSTDKNQITLIYNSNTSIGKQTYAYVSDSKKKIRSINTAKNSLTSTQWVEIAEKHSHLVSFSILVVGENFHALNHPTDFLKFTESDSAGIFRNPAKEK